MTSVTMAARIDPTDKAAGYIVRRSEVSTGDAVDQALIGYSDLP